jgi:hypothetical protein
MNQQQMGGWQISKPTWTISLEAFGEPCLEYVQVGDSEWADRELRFEPFEYLYGHGFTVSIWGRLRNEFGLRTPKVEVPVPKQPWFFQGADSPWECFALQALLSGDIRGPYSEVVVGRFVWDHVALSDWAKEWCSGFHDRMSLLKAQEARDRE